MRRKVMQAAAAIAIMWAAPASADTVCEWMDFAGRISAAAGTAGGERSPELSRAQTRVALAMFEALNAIDRRYDSYLDLPLGDASASLDAAAVTATHRVLLHFYPGQKVALDENYNVAMEAVTDRAKREAGKLIGEAAARAAINAGGIDPAVTQTPYRPRARPGEWTATQLPVYAPYATAFRPWVLPRILHERPAGAAAGARQRRLGARL